MRLNDRRDGSIKVFLILVLILANLAVALAHHRAPSQPPGSGRRGGPVFGALAENFSGSQAARALGEAPIAAREARALPGQLQRQP